MTLDTLNKANEIADSINTMERMYKMIRDGKCIKLTNSDGIREVTTDPVLIRAFIGAILNRQSELAEELERL